MTCVCCLFLVLSDFVKVKSDRAFASIVEDATFVSAVKFKLAKTDLVVVLIFEHIQQIHMRLMIVWCHAFYVMLIQGVFFVLHT